MGCQGDAILPIEWRKSNTSPAERNQIASQDVTTTARAFQERWSGFLVRSMSPNGYRWLSIVSHFRCVAESIEVSPRGFVCFAQNSQIITWRYGPRFSRVGRHISLQRSGTRPGGPSPMDCATSEPHETRLSTVSQRKDSFSAPGSIRLRCICPFQRGAQ